VLTADLSRQTINGQIIKKKKKYKKLQKTALTQPEWEANKRE